MRFSIAALVAGAAGAVASGVTTEVVTAYTTYCPEATSIVHGSQTYSISTPGHITMTNGPYTVTRPIQTSAVTQCQSCSTAVPQVSASSVPVIPIAPTAAASTPLVPGVDATGSAGASGTPVPSPVFNAAAANAAAGAGAGLAAVFGAFALLL
ncbi:unnamed protein product [Penicillium salamii]|uniref:Clock-controlled protein 6 n=1 Tax=Penicillium salamii TaxID=1612424 RepID=A0A9W4JRF6_9EURO|nr:unnamed protein product [Penicillium salamii]CAG8396159.1 unnamed protein product [Penicillium salamii]CAG8415332.1 unnamed protein product [Penicillium salamii]CAG8420583.1 unnamed protein product [Penicillium salamii]